MIQRTNNRPNLSFTDNIADYITIHETANLAKTAGAESHASWLFRDDGTGAGYSWHFTVDDQPVVYQSLEETEQGWHAGDGIGPGNRESIGVELCICEGSDFEATREHAAELVAYLNSKGHGLRGTVQHEKWSGKNCPAIIREQGLWDSFLKRIAHYSSKKEAPWLPNTPKAEAAPPIERPVPTPPPLPPAPNLQPSTPPLIQGARTLRKGAPELAATGSTGGLMALLNSVGVNIDIEILIAVMVAVPPLLFAARRLIRDGLNTLRELRSAFTFDEG